MLSLHSASVIRGIGTENIPISASCNHPNGIGVGISGTSPVLGVLNADERSRPKVKIGNERPERAVKILCTGTGSKWVVRKRLVRRSIYM